MTQSDGLTAFSDMHYMLIYKYVIETVQVPNPEKCRRIMANILVKDKLVSIPSLWNNGIWRATS